MFGKLTTGLAVATLVTALATGAQAHAMLEAATPPVNGVIAGSPKEIRITFSEDIVAAFSGVALKGPGGGVIATGKGALDKEGTTLIVPVTSVLKPGTYEVQWRAVSTDTHKMTGTYTFTVK